MMDDQNISAFIRICAGIGALLAGAGVGGYLLWGVLAGRLGLSKEGMIGLNGGLRRLRGEVAQDNENQLRALEDRLMRRLEELRTELRQELAEVRQDVRSNKKETDANLTELWRGRRTR